jgi:hypothetical protein
LNRPQRYLNRMILFLVAVIVVCGVIAPALYSAFMGNPALNGIIMGAMLVGIVYIFRQVATLTPEVAWIEKYRRRDGAATASAPPRLLAPMATMLGERRGGRVSLSAIAMRSLLDGIATRLDEARELSRYFIGLLVFLGLLGTFYGLLETLHSVGGVINNLSVGGGDVTRAFNDLKNGLNARLPRPPGRPGAEPFLQRSRGMAVELHQAVRRRAALGFRRCLGARLYPGPARADGG